MNVDVLIIGAGVAGLAALSGLRQAGVSALCVEARDRVGGRVRTVHDPLSPLPIELGAEFIHGRPPEIWDIVRATHSAVYDGTDASLHLREGEIQERLESWDLVDRILADMQSAAQNGPDISFEQFLHTSAYTEASKESARGYIEGFNAAKSEIISIQALAEETKAADAIEGDRVFRFFHGYDCVSSHLLQSVPDAEASLLLNTVVEAVSWSEGKIDARVRHAVTGERETIFARSAIVTVPLGVLQNGDIAFHPEPAAILKAARELSFGHVVRVVLRFREPFWESKAHLADAGFLLSQQPVFPTWWTTLAARSANVTGWSAGRKAEPLLGESRSSVIAQAITSLANITGFPKQMVQANLEAAYFHDWHADAFARGAYSYVPAGALNARRLLSQPVDNTLFFAGEATDCDGHSATVHGAIATGRRAARQVMDARGH